VAMWSVHPSGIDVANAKLVHTSLSESAAGATPLNITAAGGLVSYQHAEDSKYASSRVWRHLTGKLSCECAFDT